VKVEIWSDVACPWCHIGKRRFEAALDRFEHRDQIELEWKSFELDPSAQSQGADGAADEGDYADRLARKYGTGRAGAQEMLNTMTATAAAEGLNFHFEKAIKTNTFDAHQVIHLAGERGVQDPVKERLLRGYFSEGAAVGDRRVLTQLGSEAGLDAAEVQAALEDQRYAAAVREDEAEASRLGISAVPFFVVNRKYGIAGAQPADQILEVLEQAWAEAHPLVMATGRHAAEEAAPACGPDGCPT